VAPSRQGYVTQHDRPPADIELRTTNENGIEKQELVRTSNKNHIVDTRQLFLLIEGQAFMFPNAGTRHTFVRRLQSHFNQLRDPETGELLPSFLHKYRFTTKPDRNVKGNWFGVHRRPRRRGDNRS
jgi:hypothetical protein